MPRILSLVPCITQTLLDLGGESMLVGRTRYCPCAAAPVVGGIHDIDLESVVAAQPDIVLADPEENGPANIEALQHRVPVHLVRVRSVRESLDFITDMRRLLNAEAPAAERVEPFLREPQPVCGRAVTLIWRGPWMVVGSGTYPAAILRHFGWETPVERPGYGPVALEEVARLAPDLLLLPSEPYDWQPEDRAELRQHLPATRVVPVDGRALFWYGSAMVTMAPSALRALDQNEKC